ncbi:hypothetical protein, partial [Solemya elarraichensis gill symbiont]|uniref:hypothetical protein n=1 Tax=Solemya elarraichensis gill symbiont TaxID=1918949 RepID=UPI0014289106
FLWRWRTSEKQSRLVATGDYAPSILSPWRAAFVSLCDRLNVESARWRAPTLLSCADKKVGKETAPYRRLVTRNLIITA